MGLRQNNAFEINKVASQFKRGLVDTSSIVYLLGLDLKPKTREFLRIALNITESSHCASLLFDAANREYKFSNIWTCTDFLNANNVKEMFKSF